MGAEEVRLQHKATRQRAVLLHLSRAACRYEPGCTEWSADSHDEIDYSIAIHMMNFPDP
jgi:hypothetical protein